ncbi:caspase domain-containing protein [Candidatus Izemoplasma sp. B36]|uniref:caspase family protein n=1 Tax=Candidatus Izemoplasma sp. B36 TaxID=3242468 RepID=UPI003558B7B5
MRKALMIGLDGYFGAPLNCCVNDATVLGSVLEKHGDGSPNFEVEKVLDEIDKIEMIRKIEQLFSGNPDVALFYFSGHGVTVDGKAYLVTLDGREYDWGIDFEYVLNLAKNSKARNKIIILDCCYSGKFGESPFIDKDSSVIPIGVTILTASRKDEQSYEVNGHGIFTNLLIEAISGGAADVKGDITPGSVYSFIDSSLGAWFQRPLFKTNISEFISLRKVVPKVEVSVLRLLKDYFPSPTDEFKLDPSFEETNNPKYIHKLIEPFSNDSNIAIFKNLQKMRDVGLVEPVNEEHLYYAALNRKTCRLTSLGHHYWKLSKENKI